MKYKVKKSAYDFILKRSLVMNSVIELEESDRVKELVSVGCLEPLEVTTKKRSTKKKGDK